MSKPTIPGELRNVTIDSISLVSKAANRKTFKIFKSAKTEDINKEQTEQAPANVQSDERGLLDVIKSYFVSKGELADKFNAKEKGRKLGVAIDALWSTLKYNRWGDAMEGAPETDSKKIRTALTDFNKIVSDVLLGTDADIAKVAQEVEKTGRKISGARLSELKAAQAALAKIIEETDGESDSEGEANVVKEELEKLVKGCVDEAVKPLTEKLESLEKIEKESAAGSAAESQETSADESDVQKNEEAAEPDIAAIVKSAISEVVAPIGERLEKLEKSRGFSNRIPETTDVQKENQIFAGVFTGF